VQRSNEILAVSRAHWLAELSSALTEARRLMRELDPSDASFEAMELCSRIDALRREVDSMRLGRISRTAADFGPEWMKSPWHPGPSMAAKPPPRSGAGCEVQVDA
jgi:hypothetical protein